MNARKIKDSALSTYGDLRKSYIDTLEQRRTNKPHFTIVPDYEKPLRQWKGALIALPIMLFAGIVSMIALNTAIAENQYEITRLTHQARQLQQETESLNALSNYNNSPQVLNKKAKDLGMITAGTRGILDLSTGEFKETEGATPNNNYAYEDSIPLPEKPKLVNTQRDVDAVPMDDKTAKEVTNPNKPKTAPQPKPTVSQTVPKTVKKTYIGPGDPRPSDWNAEKLKGGTIPAPVMKAEH